MSWQDLSVISWTGMRGVVTLASAATVTALFKQGEAIPAHDIIYLTAFVVTIGTLLIQGVTLPFVIKWLKVTDPDQAKRDAAAERALVSKTYQVALEEMKPQWQALTEKIGAEKTEKIIQRIQQMAIAQTQAQQADEDLEEAVDETEVALPGKPSLQQRKEFGKFMNDARRQINDIRREVIIRERDAGNLDEEVMRTVLTELDAESFAMDKSWQNRMRA